MLGGPRIWVKRDDLTGSLLTGNKVRKLEYLMADAQNRGATAVITCGGIQSNHCRATAVAAAQLGMKASLILRGDSVDHADGNLLLDRLTGAHTALYPPDRYRQSLPELFEYWRSHWTSRGHRAYMIPTGGSNALGLWGYLEAAREMHEQFTEAGIEPEVVATATGSGGTQTGLSLGFAHWRPRLQVIGMAVCDDADYFARKAAADMIAWSERFNPSLGQRWVERITIRTNEQYRGPGYGVAGPEVFETIAWLARTEGIVLDPVYTGKAFHGLVSEIKRGAWAGARHIVFVHTGGVFGLFPYRTNFTEVIDNNGESIP